MDPFADGSIRGITANIIGYNYNGIDLRKEQVEDNYKNADEIGLSNINWVCDDSLNMSDHFNDESMDLVFTCPPYFDLEVYSDDKSDISNMDYESFEKVYAAILRNASTKMEENRFAIVVISDVRDNKGFYRDLTGLTKKSFADEGLFFYNDLILLNTAGSAALRVRQSMNNRKIVRIHQNVLVFYKGNPKEIKNHFEPLEFLENDLETLLESLEE